jgi:hypothetical protein
LAEVDGGRDGDEGNGLVMAVDAEADEADAVLVLGTTAAGGRRLWA